MALQPEARHTVTEFAAGRYTVLIADDQPEMRELAEHVLQRRLPCRFLHAGDGDEVLAILEHETPDALITDMMMPGPHGIELVREVKARFPEVGIIAMTGHPTEFPYVEVVRAGAEDFINKPFYPAELEAKLLRLLRERETLQTRRAAESKYRNLFKLSMDGMLIVDAETLRISDANDAFLAMCGRGIDELDGVPLFEVFGERDRTRIEQWLAICAHGGKGTLADLVVASKTGRLVHADVSVTFIDVDGHRLLFLGCKDVTDKVNVEQQLAEAAQKDALTGLFNKRTFQNRLEVAIARAREKRIPLCLIFIDLDNFKRCNDTHGHQVGDKLLMAIGEVIGKSIRSTSDEGFRLGGDEFALILLGAETGNALHVAERMQAEFAKIERYETTMSIGIAPFLTELQSETFVRAADEALYKAKGAGKNTIYVAGAQ